MENTKKTNNHQEGNSKSCILNYYNNLENNEKPIKTETIKLKGTELEELDEPIKYTINIKTLKNGYKEIYIEAIEVIDEEEVLTNLNTLNEVLSMISIGTEEEEYNLSDIEDLDHKIAEKFYDGTIILKDKDAEKLIQALKESIADEYFNRKVLEDMEIALNN